MAPGGLHRSHGSSQSSSFAQSFFGMFSNMFPADKIVSGSVPSTAGLERGQLTAEEIANMTAPGNCRVQPQVPRQAESHSTAYGVMSQTDSFHHASGGNDPFSSLRTHSDSRNDDFSSSRQQWKCSTPSAQPPPTLQQQYQSMFDNMTPHALANVETFDNSMPPAYGGYGLAPADSMAHALANAETFENSMTPYGLRPADSMVIESDTGSIMEARSPPCYLTPYPRDTASVMEARSPEAYSTPYGPAPSLGSFDMGGWAHTKEQHKVIMTLQQKLAQQQLEDTKEQHKVIMSLQQKLAQQQQIQQQHAQQQHAQQQQAQQEHALKQQLALKQQQQQLEIAGRQQQQQALKQQQQEQALKQQQEHALKQQQQEQAQRQRAQEQKQRQQVPQAETIDNRLPQQVPQQLPQAQSSKRSSASDDLLDKHVEFYLSKHPGVRESRRIRQQKRGKYWINGREVKVDWEHNDPFGGDGFLIVIDGPLRMPFEDYVKKCKVR